MYGKGAMSGGGGGKPGMEPMKGGGGMGGGFGGGGGGGGGGGMLSPEEVKEAFREFDLDKNGYVGAAEISHILQSMGEKATDDEAGVLLRTSTSPTLILLLPPPHVLLAFTLTD